MAKFRRARKDYPAGVIAIYDNNGKTADRYTVVFEPYTLPKDGRVYSGCDVYPYLGMSGAPFHPQGVGMHGESVGRRIVLRDKVIRFEDLPADCQRAVMQDLED